MKERYSFWFFDFLPFRSNKVPKETESVREKICSVVQGLQSHPPPNLPLEGGGVKRDFLYVLPFKGRAREGMG
jgi:hypothetical protein